MFVLQNEVESSSQVRGGRENSHRYSFQDGSQWTPPPNLSPKVHKEQIT